MSLAPSRLSEYLLGKRALGVKSLEKMARSDHLTAALRERIAQIAMLRRGEIESPVALSPEEKFWFLASDVQYMLTMTWFESLRSESDGSGLGDSSSARGATAAELAARFSMPTAEAERVVERLAAVGLLTKVDGRYTARREARMEIRTNEFPAKLMRQGHISGVQKLAHLIETVEPQAREFKLGTFALDRSQLPIVKALVQSLFDQINALAKVSDKSDVYLVSFGAAPVTSTHARPDDAAARH